MIRSNWSFDPFTLGAYSYAPTGISDNDWDAIQHPVGKIWFAGEHTMKELFGFLHGAVDSGRLAAKKILACRRSESKCPQEFKRNTTCQQGNCCSLYYSFTKDNYLILL